MLDIPTLVVQGFLFFVVVLIVLKFLWKPLVNAIETRNKILADSNQAASEAVSAVEKASAEARKIIAEARQEASTMVEKASRRGGEIFGAAQQRAQQEANEMIAAAKSSLQRETESAWQNLEPRVQAISREVTRKLLGKNAVDSH
jgi:F-type H+-transporting ATPase subunit b